ncbi:uncharacterized protein LOC133849463 [Drosophila sulfurigaster albostrigata]|uniref:uncharacterized protein LOC133849463 n=1 Tax=Drosophila sulfurigaster albostrigata TaxID=89887 RepID=UPI002D21A15D|nr:uncharacterized protein LOC133849463 [Drosophila sulfurigaster albostrigata]
MPCSKVLITLSALLLLSLLAVVSAFGNEYVHIKVHVPKDQAPSIAVDAEPVSPHKVIHHFHHHAPPHQRLRGRAPPPSKLKTSPLLESVILSDLDKPLHMSEHADYLNHAKELAEHLSETYVVKKAPPPPPKKKVNTYTIIEEKHRSNGYDYEPRPQHDVDTYHVIDKRPQHQYHKQQHQHHYHQQPDDDDDDVGYHYAAPGRVHRNKAPYLSGAYAEPAPVEEPSDLDQGYSYTPPSYPSARAPAHTLEAPDESPLETQYLFDYGPSGGGGSSSGFRPSPQLHTQPQDIYEDDIDAYAGPVPTRRRRPSSQDWASRSGYSGSGVDSYKAGHVQGLGSSRYPQAGPYL